MFVKKQLPLILALFIFFVNTYKPKRLLQKLQKFKIKNKSKIKIVLEKLNNFIFKLIFILHYIFLFLQKP